MIPFFGSLAGLMRFTSLAYLAFLAVCVVVYFILPGVRSRTAFLLLVSAAFYLTLSPRTFVILVAVTAFTYSVGLALEHPGFQGKPRGSAGRRLLLASGILAVVAVLVSYKYLPFLGRLASGVLGDAAGTPSWTLVRLALPIGVSFWTFQSIAYLVDVYRGRTEAVRNPFTFSLAVMFFPIVTSGPITRIQSIAAQLERKHRFDYEGMQSGLLLIGLGFFKKLMIADRLAIFVNTVFDNPSAFSATKNGLVFLVAAVFFSIQLYCDFSGYTDIVRGSARLFGVQLPPNFAAPYFSRSVREFWRRWHMTLMDWFRDYVYIPLGGNRHGPVRRYVNLMTVFAISGLWHGAGFTYVVWGLLNGFYVVTGELLGPLRDRAVRLLGIDRDSFGHHAFQTVLTFGLVTIAWVFFRANSLSDALHIISCMFFPTVWVFNDGTLVNQGLTAAELFVALLSIGALGVIEWTSMGRDMLSALNRRPLIYRWTAYYALILTVVIFGHYGGTYNPADFLYFKY